MRLIGYSQAGSKFVFGDQLGGSQPVVFAFQVLPSSSLFQACSTILYFLGVMQSICARDGDHNAQSDGRERRGVHQCRRQYLHGSNEAPLTIKPFLAGMTESELLPS